MLYEVITDNAPELTTHVNWQHLSGNSVLFEWAENGFSPDAYRITMGTTEGGINVFDSGSLVPSINSQTIPSIPDGGVDVYLRFVITSYSIHYTKLYEQVWDKNTGVRLLNEDVDASTSYQSSLLLSVDTES